MLYSEYENHKDCGESGENAFEVIHQDTLRFDRSRSLPQPETKLLRETTQSFGAFSRDARAIPRREAAASRNAAIIRRTTDASTSQRQRRRVAAREGARQSAPALRARRPDASGPSKTPPSPKSPTE